MTDHLPLRSNAVRLNTRISEQLFGEAPSQALAGGPVGVGQAGALAGGDKATGPGAGEAESLVLRGHQRLAVPDGGVQAGVRSGDRDRRGQPRRPSSRAADALERPAPGRGGPAGQGHLRGRKRSPRLFASRLCRAGPPPAQQSNPQPRPGRLRRPRSGPRGASRRRAADLPPGRHTLEPDRSGCLREELGATTRSTPPSKNTRTVRLPDVPHVEISASSPATPKRRRSPPGRSPQEGLLEPSVETDQVYPGGTVDRWRRRPKRGGARLYPGRTVLYGDSFNGVSFDKLVQVLRRRDPAASGGARRRRGPPG